MSLISLQIPNLIQGVSQQPPQMRLPSQLEEQINAYPSLTEGLTKRPPTNHISRLATDVNASFIHFINRDSIERYVVRGTSTSLKVFTLAGVEKTIYAGLTGSTAFTFPDYLNTPSNLRALTVADYTFLLNTGTTVTMAGTASAALDQVGLVAIIQASYKTKYTITIRHNSTDYPYSTTTPDTTGADTEAIAVILMGLINTASSSGTALHYVSATVTGSTIVLTQSQTGSPRTFTVKTSDSGGGTLMSATKGKTARLSDLPLAAPHGFRIAIGSDIEDPTTGDYYVSFIANDGVSGTGRWEECVGFGVTTTLSDSTLPYVLVRRSDGNFACYKPTWDLRLVGDAVTAPPPSFVGRKINDMFLYRNRFGFLADNKVVMSEAGNYFGFFRTTSTQVLESDPIDVSVAHSQVSTLRAAVGWDERLILFTDTTQFSLGSGADTNLTPETVEVVQTTDFENFSSVCKPQPTGRSLLFIQSKGQNSGVREYVRISVDEKYDGLDITANIPAYIAGVPQQIAVSTHDSTAFLRTTTGLYNHKWFVNGSEKIQSAWSKWDLGADAVVVGMHWYDHILYMVITRGTETFLEKVEFEGRFTDPGLTWGVHLDRRVQATGTAGSAYGTTEFLFATNQNLSTYGAVVVANGIKYQPIQLTSTKAVVLANLTNVVAWVGVPYEMRWTFSKQYPRNNDKPVIDGRLQLTYGVVSFEETGNFKVEVTPKYRTPFSYTFDGSILGGSLLAGTANLVTDSFRFPIHCRAADATVSVVSTSHLPCRIQSASFEANYSTRNRTL